MDTVPTPSRHRAPLPLRARLYGALVASSIPAAMLIVGFTLGVWSAR